MCTVKAQQLYLRRAGPCPESSPSPELGLQAAPHQRRDSCPVVGALPLFRHPGAEFASILQDLGNSSIQSELPTCL